MKLLTVEQVAKDHLSVSRSTVLRLIATNSLSAVCIHRGKRKAIYRVRPEVLDKWIRDRERKGQSHQPPSVTIIGELKTTDVKPANGQAPDSETSA
jgi:excisionase family DNA binding protein